VAAWDGFKAQEKPSRKSVLDGIPLGMPSLALADKLIGRAQKVGVLDEHAPAIVPVASEDELGPLLLAIVASAKAQGFDAERALRTTLRGLREEIAESEALAATDAGVIARPADAPRPAGDARPADDA
jgi:XTP/dITP diphosphohydrolase